MSALGVPGERDAWLRLVAEDAHASTGKVNAQFNESIRALTEGNIPDWAKHHLAITKQLELAVAQMKVAGETVPEDVIHVLEESQEAVNKLAGKISGAIFNRLTAPSIDEHGLLSAKTPALGKLLLIYEKALYSFLWISPEALKEVGVSTIPDWARHHLAITASFDLAVQDLKKGGIEIPEKIMKGLERSRFMVSLLAKKIGAEEIRNFLTPENIEKYSFLEDEPFGHRYAWNLNLGLLMNVYDRTDDPELKKKIRFLAANYLAKASGIEPEMIGSEDADEEMMRIIKETTQFGIGRRYYHRMAPTLGHYSGLESAIEEALSESQQGGSMPLVIDTPDMAQLFPLSRKFSVIDPRKPKKWEVAIADFLKQHFRHAQDPGSPFIAPFLLLDLTSYLGACIQTNGDPGKEAIFQAKLNEVEAKIKSAIFMAIVQAEKNYPDFRKAFDIKQGSLIDLIQVRIACICRIQIGDVGVLKILDFTPRDYYPEVVELQNKYLKQFVSNCGIYISAVNMRMQLYNFTDFGAETNPRYAVKGANAIYFHNRSEILNTQLFQRFLHRVNAEEMARDNPHIAVLGGGTLRLVEGLLNEITDEKWNSLNENPDTRELFQTSLYRLREHLATAEHSLNDYNKFILALELAHCEIATLLTLSSPFKEGDFAKIYAPLLAPVVPENLRRNVKIGLAKTGMNAFAGVNLALLQMSPHPEIRYGNTLYYELRNMIGKTRSFDASKGSKEDLSKIDLYVGQYSPNVEPGITKTDYRVGTVEEDVRLILDAKPKDRPLTVAIDCTIDYTNSQKVKNLLETFHKEIEEGRLNFVFFESGQKFDMMGMDNYYGAPFYIVNNGAEHWKPFADITTQEVFKTDPLSTQWFCHAFRYCPADAERYRQIYFNNAREIMRHVPESLKPNPRANPAQRVVVSTVDEKIEPAFIEVKVLVGGEERLKEIVRDFRRICTNKGVKLYRRQSFGYFHPNVMMIPPGCIRINPGLDPKENDAIIACLQKLTQLN